MEMHALKCQDPNCVSFITSKIDSVYQNGDVEPIRIVVPSDNRPVIVYFAEGSKFILIKCGNKDCSSGNKKTVIVDQQDYSTSLDNRFDVAIGKDDLPIVMFGAAPDSHVLKCDNSDCTQFHVGLTLIGKTPSRQPSITIGQDGNPIFSFVESSLALRTVKCQMIDCSGPVIESLHPTPYDVVNQTIVVPPDGIPLIAYTEYQGQLYALKCGTPSCAGGQDTITVLGTSPVSEFSKSGTNTMPLVNGTTPVITYRTYSQSTFHLDVITCVNYACTNFTSVQDVHTSPYGWVSQMIKS